METISIMDGLILTVVSMLVVFSVLGALWGITEWTSKLLGEIEETPSVEPTSCFVLPEGEPNGLKPLPTNPTHQLVAEIMALTLASEDQSNIKLEIHESIRIK